MNITKRQLKRIIKEEKAKLLNEEGADCIKDYMRMGYSRAQAYKECDDGSDDYSTYSSYSRRPKFKTAYRTATSNAPQIAAVEAALAIKPNNFLSSILDQLKNGRSLSSKQKPIVKRIIKKNDPTAAALFESSARVKKRKGNHAMKITRRQLRKIIKEAARGSDSLADLRDGSYSRKKIDKWLDWAEGYGLQQEIDNEGQIIFYFDMDLDSDGTIVREAESMLQRSGGSIENAGFAQDGSMVIYTGVYSA